MSVKKSSTKISSVPSPKPIMLSYVVLKKEYLNDKINIRKEASSTSEIIGTMDKEKQYQFISKSGLWFKISLNTESIGHYTTVSVVNSIFLVIACDALFSVLLTELKL